MLKPKIKEIKRISRVRRCFQKEDDDPFRINLRQGAVFGETKAKKAAGMMVKMIKDKKVIRKAILLCGKTGTGKKTLAKAIAESLGENIPFSTLNSSNMFSSERSKIDILEEAFKHSVGLQIIEESPILEGEVIAINLSGVSESEKKIGNIILKTTQEQGTYHLTQENIQSLQKEKVACGDVITIDRTSGKVLKAGKSFHTITEFSDFSCNIRFVSCPEGEIAKIKKIINTLTLHEIEAIESRKKDFQKLFCEAIGDVRQQTNNFWERWEKDQIVPGVLFIEEAHMLGLECFSFLTKVLESEGSPTIILATDKAAVNIQNTNFIEPHGIPAHFLSHLWIIHTQSYKEDELREIIRFKSWEEDFEITEEAFSLLVAIAEQINLKYAIDLMNISSIVAIKRKAVQIDLTDIKRSYSMFLDKKRSSEYLKIPSFFFCQPNS